VVVIAAISVATFVSLFAILKPRWGAAPAAASAAQPPTAYA
jgi:hypothetical protein